MALITTHQPLLSDLIRADVPLIAMSFADNDIDERVADSRELGVDVVELRIDQFSSTDTTYVTEQLRRFSEFPTIATIRTQDEGGRWAGSDEERLQLFRAAIPEVHGVDIELASEAILSDVVAEAREKDRLVIISHHDFSGTPSLSELTDMAMSAKEHGADLVKISTMTAGRDDVQTLAAFLVQHAELGLIVIGMGGHGVVTRVAFPVLGSRLTYAFSGQPAVSGQVRFDRTFDCLRMFSPEFNEKKIIELGLLEDA